MPKVNRIFLVKGITFRYLDFFQGFEKSKEKLALDQLEQAAEKSVLFAVRTSVGYNGR